VEAVEGEPQEETAATQDSLETNSAPPVPLEMELEPPLAVDWVRLALLLVMLLVALLLSYRTYKRGLMSGSQSLPTPLTKS
jgi:hypothetical protein